MGVEKEQVLEALEDKRFDIGVCGLWYGANYGSVMTYFSLYKTLTKLGYSVLMIDKRDVGGNDPEKNADCHSRIFAAKHYEAISPSLKPEDLHLLNKYCDTFLMGCDQVWNFGVASNFGYNNYFDYIADDKKKMSYASSFGHSTSFTPRENISDVTKLLQRFDFISVREESAVTVLKNEFGLEGTQVLDPVFLLEQEEYDVVLNDAKPEEEKFILAYILDPTEEIREALVHAQEKFGVKLIIILDGRGDSKRNKEILDLPNIIERLNAPQWLWYIKHAEFVITDSCHGASFAVVFERPFVCIANKRRGTARFESLFNLLQMEGRLIYNPKRILTEEKLLAPIDYSHINEILKMERSRSLRWLTTALKQEKETFYNVKCVIKKECCGCGACFNICPVDAISMGYDEEGVLYPRIDENKCIKCKKCMTVCPSLHPVLNHSKEPDCYAAFGDDALREISSSGGIFTLVAEKVLKDGGAVCGAAFNEAFELSQQVVYQKEDLPKLRGSKYIQSDSKRTYQEILKVLKDNKPALFVGCPCQVAGLRSFLGKEYKNLFTIDLLCHGGPAPGTFSKYLEEVHGKKKIAYVGFRDKEYFGWIAGMTVKYQDGSKFRKSRAEDLFYRAFQPCLSVRPHCQVCNYARLPRQGDFTLGDFWGIDKLNPALTDGKGTSILSVNSPKGENMLAGIKEKLLVLQKVDTNHILTHGQPYGAPYRSNPRRYRFHRMLINCSFEKTIECCEQNKFDFGIYGMNADSYGDILAYYALYEAVSKLGYSVLMIKRPRELEDKVTPLKYRLQSFADRYYPMVSIQDKIRKRPALNETCVNYLIGENQVWTNKAADYFTFAEETKARIAYGSSFRKKGSDKISAGYAAECLRGFTAIASPQKPAYQNKVVVDAVFLPERKIYDDLTARSEIKMEKQFICGYCAQMDEEQKKEMIKYASSQGMEYVELYEDLPVEDWLYYLKNASLMVTNQRDGINMAIIFDTPMLISGSLDTETADYIKLLKLENRILDKLALTKELVDKAAEGYAAVQVLKEKKEDSAAWLQMTLQKAYKKSQKYNGSKGSLRVLKAIKNKMPPKFKEKIYFLVKKNKFYNKHIKPL